MFKPLQVCREAGRGNECSLKPIKKRYKCCIKTSPIYIQILIPKVPQNFHADKTS